jgi:hypothetical protein
MALSFVTGCGGSTLGSEETPEGGVGIVTNRQPNCLGPSSLGPGIEEALPCVPGQDLPVDCILCQSVPACRGAYADAGAD